MFPTFKNKEYILTNLIGLRLEPPKKGDVIVFRSPTDRDKDFIKRVIGTPGDTVRLQEGYVFVNGRQLDESEYLSSDVRTFGGSFMREGEDVFVPAGKYIVMGDNRPYSSDSREWGPLKREDIIGKSFYVYWPLTNMRAVINPFGESKK